MSDLDYKEILWKELNLVWELCQIINSKKNELPRDQHLVWSRYLTDNSGFSIDKNRTIYGDTFEGTTIYSKGTYGIRYNYQMKMWVPFRHADIDFISL